MLPTFIFIFLLIITSTLVYLIRRSKDKKDFLEDFEILEE
jgi:hypothetical protein